MAFSRCIAFLTVVFAAFLPVWAQSHDDALDFSPDSIETAEEAYLRIRGLEQDPHSGFNPIRSLGSVVFYIPKRIIHGVRYASGYGFKLINNEKFIDTIQDFLFTDDHRFGWHPMVDFTSSHRPRIGLNLMVNAPRFDMLARGNVAGAEKYQIETILSYRLRKRDRIWRFTLSGLLSHDDDQKFYGIGFDPRSDLRSHFLPDPENDHGIYIQRRYKIQFIVGFRPSPLWETYLTSFFQERRIRDASESRRPLGVSFDLESLPGVQHPIKQAYTELSVVFNTRKQNAYISGGFRTEGYAGISTGVGEEASSFLRTGLDVLVNIPIIKGNRVVTPRLVFDTMRNISDQTDIPFPEYPRQPSFRGVSRRRMLRTDTYSFVPSLEYQWPLSFNLGGHLFIDYLIVADALTRIRTARAPWAAGFGIDFHGLDAELARIQVVVGSEGFRFLLSIGMDPLISDRIHWK